MPVIITGSEDDTVRLWHSTTYRLESTLNYGLGRVWTVECRPSGSGGGQQSVVGIGYDEGTVVVALGREHPAVSMDASGKLVCARHSEMVNANLRSIIASMTAGNEGADAADVIEASANFSPNVKNKLSLLLTRVLFFHPMNRMEPGCQLSTRKWEPQKSSLIPLPTTRTEDLLPSVEMASMSSTLPWL